MLAGEGGGEEGGGEEGRGEGGGGDTAVWKGDMASVRADGDVLTARLEARREARLEARLEARRESIRDDLSRAELRQRWLEAHEGCKLSRVSEMRPPTDPAAFAAALAAAASGDVDGVLRWIDGGGSVNAQASATGSTLLQRASAGSADGVVALLLSRGAKVQLQDGDRP